MSENIILSQIIKILLAAEEFERASTYRKNQTFVKSKQNIGPSDNK